MYVGKDVAVTLLPASYTAIDCMTVDGPVSHNKQCPVTVCRVSGMNMTLNNLVANVDMESCAENDRSM